MSKTVRKTKANFGLVARPLKSYFALRITSRIPYIKTEKYQGPLQTPRMERCATALNCY